VIDKLLTLVSAFVVGSISHTGYAGVLALMAIESACIPLPSEIIMPFSGYLVYRGVLNLWGVALAGAAGCVVGSLVAYYIAARGGRAMAERYGRYVLLSHRDLDLADRWFARHGDITIFLGRLLPIVRTFIAFPAGVCRMALGRFILFTFTGSLLWCCGLAWIGVKLGEHWRSLEGHFHQAHTVIALVLVGGLAWYIWRHLSAARRPH